MVTLFTSANLPLAAARQLPVWQKYSAVQQQSANNTSHIEAIKCHVTVLKWTLKLHQDLSCFSGPDTMFSVSHAFHLRIF